MLRLLAPALLVLLAPVVINAAFVVYEGAAGGSSVGWTVTAECGASSDSGGGTISGPNRTQLIGDLNGDTFVPFFMRVHLVPAVNPLGVGSLAVCAFPPTPASIDPLIGFTEWAMLTEEPVGLGAPAFMAENEMVHTEWSGELFTPFGSLVIDVASETPGVIGPGWDHTQIVLSFIGDTSTLAMTTAVSQQNLPTPEFFIGEAGGADWFLFMRHAHFAVVNMTLIPEPNSSWLVVVSLLAVAIRRRPAQC